MNKVFIIGRLTKDPELSYTTSNTPVARFTVAVDRPVAQDREKQADFIRVTVWSKLAENCDKYLAKGRQVAVMGRIQTGSYEKDGRTVFTQDVIAENVKFLGNKSDDSRPQTRREDERPAQNFYEIPPEFSAVDDDIPF